MRANSKNKIGNTGNSSVSHGASSSKMHLGAMKPRHSSSGENMPTMQKNTGRKPKH